MEMDDEGICGLKDRGTVNINTVWQWRILHAKKYSTHPDPFFYSNKIGLSFNVGSSSQQKLKPPFVPNGVILEVCDFARTIGKSHMHFIPNILENNFALGFESDQQRIDFTAQIQHKLENLIQNPQTGQNEVFSLCDTWKTGCSNNELYVATKMHKAESLFMEIEDISELEDLLKCSSSGNDQKDKTGCWGIEMKEVVNEDIPLLLPLCENIGLNFGTGTKQSLDPGLLTESVMLELVDFARVFTASFTSVVVSLLEHNFELDLKSQQRRNEVWLLISQMVKRGKQMAASNTNLSPEFENEPFFFNRNPLKRAYVPALSTMETLLSEETKRRKLDFNTSQEKKPPSFTKCFTKKGQGQPDKNVYKRSLSFNTDLYLSKVEEDEHCYMCPVEDDTDSESSGNGKEVQNSTGCDISTESLSNTLTTQSVTVTYAPCNSSTLNKDTSPPSVLQPKKTLEQGYGETQIDRNESKDCGINQEIVIDSIMWKLRASRVNKILLTLDKENSHLIYLKNLGVEFNVGFGPKQNLSVDDLTGPVLFKLAQFALAMNSSQQEFIMELLDNNFDLGLQSECHQKTFICEVMNRVRELKKCEDTIKFSKEIFQLPVSVSPVDIACQSNSRVIAEVSPMSNVEYCQGTAMCACNSHPETGMDFPSEPESVSEVNMDLYPFCKDIGLKLHVKCRHSTGKLAINKLTNGAMIEVVKFAEKLCGTFEQICMDVLRHNFDLHSMDSHLATTIFAQIAAVNEQMNLSDNSSLRIMKHSITDPSILMYDRKPSDIQAQNNPNLLLWMLRANHVQHILSVPHGDQCPLYSYSLCKKLCLDFNVGSGVKRRLDPKCLTNGIIVELATFAKTLQSSEKDFMTEILEFNFDLNFKSELHRSAFARQLSTQVLQLSSRNEKFPLRNKHQQFELPDLRCLEECTPHCPKCYQDRIETHPQDECEFHRMPHVHPHVITDKSPAHICTKPKFPNVPVSSFSSAEMITKPYRHSKEVGLSLCVEREHPKEKLDLHVLTEEVMLDVYHFAKKLSGSKIQIINDVLEHNFNLTHNHIEDLISHFYDRVRTNFEDLSWFNQVVDLEKVPSKVHQNGNDGPSEKVPNCEGASPSPSSSINTDLSPPLLNEPDENLPQEIDPEEQILQSIPNIFDMNHEEMATHMWKFRSRYVRKIHFDLGKKFVRRWHVKILEFNVGSQPPRNLSIDLLTTSVLYKIIHFALAMSSSQLNVLMDILEYNFDLSLQSGYHNVTFAHEIMKRVQELLACDNRDKVLNEVFALPCSLSLNDVKYEGDDSVDSEPETSQTTSDVYPFCKKIGLKLIVSHCHPDKKLELNKLTNGVVIEVLTFAEKLCGSYEQICVDVLRHNFDLDLQISDSDLAQNILSQVPFAIEENNLRSNFRKKFVTRISLNFMDSQINVSSQTYTTDAVKAEVNRSASHANDIVAQNDPDLLLWKLRANQVQQILSVPHKEQCPLYSYTRCKKLGIDFDVGSGLKRHLDPKLLTNGILCELFTLATELGSSVKHFMTEILEYNFDLHFNNSFHRNGFANTLGGETALFNRKRSSVMIKKTLFELPDERFILEVAPLCTRCSQDYYLRHVDSPHPMANVACAYENNKEKRSANAPMSTFPATEVTTKPYHCSNKAGLSLCVDNAHPIVKLDKHLLTLGVMQDVYMFSKKLCGTKWKIIYDILEHNFDLDKHYLEETVHGCLRSVNSYHGDPTWFHEVFNFRPILKEKVKSKEPHPVLSSERRELFEKRKRDMQKTKELSIQRQQSKQKEENICPHHSGLSTSQSGEHSMCPVEQDMCSENDVHVAQCKNPDWLDISGESQMNNVGENHLPTNEAASTPMSSQSQPNEIQLQGDEIEEDVQRNMPNYCVIDQEMDPELKMWKLRANRVREILPFVKMMSRQIFSKYLPFKHWSKPQTLQRPSPACFSCVPDSTQLNLNKLPTASGNLIKSHSSQSAVLKQEAMDNMQDSESEGVTPALEFDVGFQPERNLSADHLTNFALFCIALFAMQMSASQEEFMMEILKNNFAFRLKSKYNGKSFACEVMKRVRELVNCGEAAKHSTEVFKLPGLLSFGDLRNQNSRIESEAHSTSNMEECDVSPVASPSLTAENELSTATETSQNSEDLYPFCNDIGLKLTVCGCQPNKKLDVNKLTNGAMIEVFTFADKLSGSYEQICVDVLRHNFDLDLQDADSDLARKILEQVPLLIAQRNLERNFKTVRSRRRFNPIDINCQNSTSSETCCTGPIKANIDRGMSSHSDIKVQKDPDLLLWRLRVNRIQQILSVPHGEQCPFYPYKRCMKLGIDFNVGSGLKRNLDPKLLTNGIMCEIFAFTEALLSSAKHFITEIWEYNFDLNLKGELHRSAFIQQIIPICKSMYFHKNHWRTTVYKLPDPESIEEKAPRCRKCYQDRQNNPVNMTCSSHTVSDQTTADTHCSEPKPYEAPIANFRATKILLKRYRHCKGAGLSLCVDRNYPRRKLDKHVLTRAVQKDIQFFVKKLIGKKFSIISDILEHNFNLDMNDQELYSFSQFGHRISPDAGEPAWFDEVVHLEVVPPNESDPKKKVSVVPRNERKETLKRRQLAMQVNKEQRKVPVVERPQQSGNENMYPVCSRIGLDLEVSSQSEVKEKLDLSLLTTSVVFEIHKFVSKKFRQSYPKTLYKILDYNFDISSQRPRKWKFAVNTGSKFVQFVKKGRKKKRMEEIFNLPFVISTSSKKSSANEESSTDRGRLPFPDRIPVMQSGLLGTDWSYKNVDIKEEMDDPLSCTPEMHSGENYPCWDDASGCFDKKYDQDLVTVKSEEFNGNMSLTECPTGKVELKEESEMEGIQDYVLRAPQVSAAQQNVSFYYPGQCVMGTVLSTNIVQCVPLQYSVVVIKEEERKHVSDE